MKFCKFKIVTILITLTIICTCVPINTYAARSGTASQPCKLKDGTKKVVSAKEYWFSCTTRGATDFIIKTGKKSDIIVYKKKTFGKKQIFSVTSKTSFSKTLSDCAINNNSNKYLVYVKAPSSTSISCQIKTHTDTITSSKGAMWVPDDKSARYDTNILYMRYWYVDKNRVGKIVDMVSHADFLDLQSSLANGTIGVSSFVITLRFPKTGVILGIAGCLGSLTGPFDFKQQCLDKIDKVAGYAGTEHGESKYKRGCLIIEYMYNGQTLYEFKSWNGKSMKGPKGWTGKFTINK